MRRTGFGKKSSYFDEADLWKTTNERNCRPVETRKISKKEERERNLRREAGWNNYYSADTDPTVRQFYDLLTTPEPTFMTNQLSYLRQKLKKRERRPVVPEPKPILRHSKRPLWQPSPTVFLDPFEEALGEQGHCGTGSSDDHRVPHPPTSLSSCGMGHGCPHCGTVIPCRRIPRRPQTAEDDEQLQRDQGSRPSSRNRAASNTPNVPSRPSSARSSRGGAATSNMLTTKQPPPVPVSECLCMTVHPPKREIRSKTSCTGGGGAGLPRRCVRE